MSNSATSTALVPVTALTVWQNVNSQWDRLNQNFDRASHSLNDLQKILERVYEEKNKSFMEGFMQSQDAARRLSGQSGHSGSSDRADESGIPDVKNSFMGKAQKILKALDVSAFEVITYVGEKAVGYILSRRKEATRETTAGVAGSGGGSQERAGDKEEKSGILSKFSDAFGSLDVGGVFDKVKSLGETAIQGSASEEDKGKWEQVQGQMNNSIAAMGQKAMVALRPVLDMLNNAFQSEPMIAAVNFMANAFLVIATVIGMVVEGLIYMATVVQQNWDVIGPILAAIIFVYLAAMIVQVYSLAAAWLIANWPILLVVAAVALLIYIVQQSGVSISEAVSGIAAAFGWLKVFLENVVIFLYNTFISLADFFRNLFQDPTYAVQKLFYDMAMNVLDLIYQMAFGTESFAGGFVKVIAEAINGALKKFKSLTDFISKIPGFEFLADFKPNYVDAENPHVFSDMILKAKNLIPEPTSDKNVFNSEKKDYVDPEATMKDYSNRAKDMTDKFSSKVDIKEFTEEAAGLSLPGNQGLPMSPGGSLNNVKTVGEVGSINDTVDISSDDLKMLRELAEIQAIQNFVELTPTVQVTTGNINNAGDIDSIINKIGQKLNEEFISTAQGVYT